VILVETLTWVLRGFGLLYLIGGFVGARQAWFWARITPSMNKFMRVAEDFKAEVEGREPKPVTEEDRARPWWLFTGALLLMAAGAAMLIGHALSVPLLAAIIVYQLLYFVRQRRRELAATSPGEASEARPDSATINGFFAALPMAVVAAWLYHEGALI
jgi:hypothetical protein